MSSPSQKSHSSTPRKPQLIEPLTSIRFFAAFIVFISHLRLQGLISFPSQINTFFDGGRSAVTVFFVLSGFILTITFAPGTSRKQYYLNRFARIFPLVFLSLALAAPPVLASLRGLNSEKIQAMFHQSSLDPQGVLVSLLTQLTMTSAWLPIPQWYSYWNAPSWSISVEVLFYLLFPLLFVLFSRLSTRWAIMTAFALWLVQTAVTTGLLAFTTTQAVRQIVYNHPLIHLPEFIMGMLFALLFQRGSWAFGQRHANLLVLISLAAMTLIAAARIAAPQYVLLVPFCGVLIYGLAHSRGRLKQLLSHRFLVLLGESSFALYMIHTPIMLIAILLGLNGGVWGLTLIPVTVGLSILIFRYYENPLRRIIRSLGKKN